MSVPWSLPEFGRALVSEYIMSNVLVNRIVSICVVS